MPAAAARTQSPQRPTPAAPQPSVAASQRSSTDPAGPVGAPFVRLASLRSPPVTSVPTPVRSALSRDSGAPLALPVRGALERSVGLDLSPVRVHQGPQTESLVTDAGARAFAFGTSVFLGRGERATDLRLMAHEIAHVVQQQGATTLQRMGGNISSPDPFEAEADSVSTAVMSGRQAGIVGRTAPRPQFSLWDDAVGAVGSAVSAVTEFVGDIIGEALGFIKDKARLIPGYDMLGFIIGRDPITQKPVERNPVNLIRAVIGLLPGGSTIMDALQKYGIIDRVGSWLEEQLKTLGAIVGGIGQALDRFLKSLRASDVLDLGGVWDRAKRIFSEPINQIIQFVRGLANDIVDFIRDAVLYPLAALARDTRGYDLIRAILGKDPISGEPVPQDAEALIGGFLKLIGQNEILENMKKAKAIPRAVAWFRRTLGELKAFVTLVPRKFISAFKSSGVSDYLGLRGLITKVGGVFIEVVGDFVKWAGKAMWDLLELMFEVVSPKTLEYIRKTGSALKSILKNPIPFVGNLVKAAQLGFQNFAGHFAGHLREGLINWLVGALPGVYIPKGFELGEVVKFVFSVLGISWANVRAKLVTVLGETPVKAMETGFDIVVTLVRDGPAAAWEQMKGELVKLKDTVIDGIIGMVVEAITVKAVPKLIALFIPGAGFITAIIAIYDVIKVFIEKIATIMEVVRAFVDSIVSIAAGAIDSAAKKVESVLSNLLSLAISFLANFAGLGKVADKIMEIIKKVRDAVDKGLNAVVNWIVTMAKKLGKFIVQAGVPQDPKERLRLGLGAAVKAVNRFAGRRVGAVVLNPLLAAIKLRYGMQSVDVIPRGARWAVRGAVNPEGELQTDAQTEAATEGDPSGVRSQVGRALLSALPGEHTRDEVEAAIASVRGKFPTPALRRIEIGTTDEKGNYAVLVEASGLSPLLLMELLSQRVMVGLVGTLRFSSDQTLRTPREFRPTTVSPPNVPAGQFIGTQNLAGVTLVRPALMPRPADLLARPPAESVTSKAIQAVAYNTASPSAQRTAGSDNDTHAESQFIRWFNADVSPDSIKFLERVELTLSHSPCSLCSRHGTWDLVSYIQAVSGEFRKSAGHRSLPIFALRYTSAFTSGPNATTVEDIAALRSAGYSVVGPPITLTVQAREQRQRERARARIIGQGRLP